ncbi:MAG TPA: SDR family oxidoreductase [Gemmatimonadales bacterium]|nr:SDR family oxidoreductase [Gemmatimonadales bacterium]
MSSLAGQVALVTGASRGIGAAVASALRGAGARVVRVARSLERGVHDGFDDLPCDISDAAAVARMADDVLAQVGTPDVVVNSAGVFDRIPFEQTSVAELQRFLATNLVGQFAVARAFLPPMHLRGSGLLVNVGSIADHRAFPENTIYSTTKFGLRGLHETLALEYRGSGVRCSLISPGPTDTPIWDDVDPENRRGTVPRHAMLKPADVAEAVLFIATRPPRVHVEWLRIFPAA